MTSRNRRHRPRALVKGAATLEPYSNAPLDSPLVSDPSIEIHPPRDVRYCQWTLGNEKFYPAGRSVDTLPPGFYQIESNPNEGLYFRALPFAVTGLLRFPETYVDQTVAEIQDFWEKEPQFRARKLAYKRGFLFWGPPGAGKSCTIKLVCKDVIDRKGVVLKYGNPYTFQEGLRVLRQIHPDMPIVVIMEDIDDVMDQWPESEVLNFLDGVEGVDKVVFLATTNIPDRLDFRTLDRPGRFDQVLPVGPPPPKTRAMYLEHVAGEPPEDQWIKDTDGFSLAHLKELYVAVRLLGCAYEVTLARLRSMREEMPDQEKMDKLLGDGGDFGFSRGD